MTKDNASPNLVSILKGVKEMRKKAVYPGLIHW